MNYTFTDINKYLGQVEKLISNKDDFVICINENTVWVYKNGAELQKIKTITYSIKTYF